MDKPQEAPAETGRLRVQVAYAPQPERVELVDCSLPAGATVGDALRESGLLARHGLDAPDSQPPVCGVWAKIRPLDHPLKEGDRVEIYRPLKVDPKEARRQRYRREPGKARRRGSL